MVKKAVVAAALVALVCFVWGLTQNNRAIKLDCENKTIVKEKEVIKYVAQKKAVIYSKPNLARAELLELMRANKL